ncbi:ASTN2 protein, partial [Atractosteus spatula]|nr:ASTN2 protein [Atractosteus spatula]
MMSTYFESVDDLLASFGPVRDCSKENGGCRKNFKCVADRRVDSTGCMCPAGLRPMKDGSGCYDYTKGTDCSDGFNGGCEQLCLQQLVPLPDDPTSNNVLMFCGCVEEYRLAPDGRSCNLLSDACDGPKCQRHDAKLNDTLFGEMLHGYNNKTQEVNLGQVFQMTFRVNTIQTEPVHLQPSPEPATPGRGRTGRNKPAFPGTPPGTRKLYVIQRHHSREALIDSAVDNNFIKDFPQLADGLMVIPLPVEEQCRGILSEPLPNLHLLTGDAKYNEAMGYPMVQQWRVRSNLYKVKLSAITLSTDFSKILKMLNTESTREELLSFLQQYGSHYIAEALYGSELTCAIYFPSKKVQQQLWLQYQKGKGGRESTL